MKGLEWMALFYGPFLLVFLLYLLDKLIHYSDTPAEKEERIAKARHKQIINNRGAKIHTQNNYAERMTVNNHKTVKQMVMTEADKELLKQAYMNRGKYQQWLQLEPSITTTTTDDTVSDTTESIRNTTKTVETAYEDISDAVSDRMPASSILKPKDVIVSDVIRRKVADTKGEVLQYKEFGASYIARKVFNVHGGSTRPQYIAAITQLLEDDMKNNKRDGE